VLGAENLLNATQNCGVQKVIVLSKDKKAYPIKAMDYYWIVSDDRGLNYGKSYTEGQEKVTTMDDYNSQNTQRLSIPEIKEKLLSLDFIQQVLAGGVGCEY